MWQEIARIAEILDFSGVWLLNASYQWACTSLAREEDGVPWLVRTLDWPFRGLGRHAEVARMRGRGGDFFSITWPGYVGALTAMAPFRFAACINQAPMRRLTRIAGCARSISPSNTLAGWRLRRAACRRTNCSATPSKSASDYGAARRMLETTPVARPVIFTLVGCAAGESCVIERTETGFRHARRPTPAPPTTGCRTGPRWEGRIGTRRFLTSSFAEAAGYSRARREALAGWQRCAC